MPSKVHLFDACSSLFSEVDWTEFYRTIFPEGSFERMGRREDSRPNGIAISISPCGSSSASRVKRFIVTDDLEVLGDLIASDDFCLMSPIGYVGKARTSTNARHLYALAIDLDGVSTMTEWNYLLRQLYHGHEMLAWVWGLPRPTYLVCSGTGLHLYYVFEQPIALFPNVVKELEKLKRRLTWQAWTQGAADKYHREHVQYESLFQGFRLVGSITKTGTRCRAFQFEEGRKVSVDYLNQFVPDEYRVEQLAYESRLTLKNAKEKYPEWYQRRILEEQPRGRWTCKRDLYDWWKCKAIAGGKIGHRYWCIMTLATYAIKCRIPYEELRKDAYEVREALDDEANPLTADDVEHALKAYLEGYVNYPIHTIINRTGLCIERNKRNYRKQSQHLKIARFARDLNYEEENGWRNNTGAPLKKEIVQQWRQENPTGRKSDCIRDTGLSKPTVYKWWNDENDKTDS